MYMYLQASLGRIEPGMNIDAPEAGFDAMAQVILCYDIIGWREEAVKIILYFSDDTFKFAGEGRVCTCTMYMYLYMYIVHVLFSNVIVYMYSVHVASVFTTIIIYTYNMYLCACVRACMCVCVCVHVYVCVCVVCRYYDTV